MLRLQRYDTTKKNPNHAHNRVNTPEAPLGTWTNTPITQTPENTDWINYLISHGNFKLVEEADPTQS